MMGFARAQPILQAMTGSTNTTRALLLDRPDERPQDAERVLELGVAVAPEHVGGRHERAAAPLDGALIPGIDILYRQRDVEPGGLLQRVAVLRIGVAHHHRAAV